MCVLAYPLVGHSLHASMGLEICMPLDDRSVDVLHDFTVNMPVFTQFSVALMPWSPLLPAH